MAVSSASASAADEPGPPYVSSCVSEIGGAYEPSLLGSVYGDGRGHFNSFSLSYERSKMKKKDVHIENSLIIDASWTLNDKPLSGSSKFVGGSLSVSGFAVEGVSFPLTGRLSYDGKVVRQTRFEKDGTEIYAIKHNGRPMMKFGSRSSSHHEITRDIPNIFGIRSIQFDYVDSAGRTVRRLTTRFPNWGTFTRATKKVIKGGLCYEIRPPVA